MPVSPSYPGVYIDELSSGIKTITGVSTSITAFVGYTARGLDQRPKRIFSFADFERSFGGIAADSELSYCVQHFFDNGGSDAIIVRIPKNDAVGATITLKDDVAGTGKNALTFSALSKGAWANNVVIDVDYVAVSDTKSFNLTIVDLATGTSESFTNVTVDPAKTNFVVSVINDPDNGSQMVSVTIPDSSAGRPVQTGVPGTDITLTNLKNDKDYSIKITSDVPAGKIAALSVTVIKQGDPVPTSVAGLCGIVEKKANQVLGQALPGAAIRCVPSASGGGLRIFANYALALLGDSIDATLSFTDGGVGLLTLLGLNTAVSNVSHYRLGSGRATLAQLGATAGVDGKILPKTDDLIGSQANFTGINALDKVDLFNILCIPDATRAKASDPNALDSDNVSPNSVFTAAALLCQRRRAFLIIDAPPNVNTPDRGVDWKTSGLTVSSTYAAAYFPRVRTADPLNNYQMRTFAPCGVVAGLYARTDATRGVWKAPAGVDASLTDVQSLVYRLNDAENGVLNPLGLNCLRTFPIYGSVCWGARTLAGADASPSDWKYVPVRRVALFIEESLFRGTQWVVFEPNDEPLWSQIRVNLTAFMQGLFRQGAFQGSTPQQAYSVRCDSTTTTQDDINKGIVNIVVGFAPLKPAEFVFIKIQQLAGQIAA